MTDREFVVIDADNWAERLVPALAGEIDGYINDLDREAIFDALVEFVDRTHPDGAIVRHPIDEEQPLAADAPLLIPHTRIFVEVGALRHGVIKRVVATVAKSAILAATDPRIAFAGVAIDAAVDVYEKLSLLDAADFALAEAVAEECRATKSSAKAIALAGAGSDVADIETRLDALVERGVLARDENGFRVVF